jgi:hypothetical protein
LRDRRFSIADAKVLLFSELASVSPKKISSFRELFRKALIPNLQIENYFLRA